MRAKELDVHRTVLIGDSDYQSIVIALDIEDHPVVADDARAAILILDVLGTGPVRRHRLPCCTDSWVPRQSPCCFTPLGRWGCQSWRSLRSRSFLLLRAVARS